jgi:serine/threonine protein kinase
MTRVFLNRRAALSISKPIGAGSVGTIFRLKFNCNKRVIKKIVKVYTDSQDMEEEKRMYQLLGFHKHIARICFKTEVNVKHIKHYLVFEEYKTDLYLLKQKLVASKKWNKTHALSVAWQLLAGLQHIHNANVVHGDLKPSNILVDWDNTVKIADFDQSRRVGEMVDCTYSTNVYRPPECMFPTKQNPLLLKTSIDIFSLGLILWGLFHVRKPTCEIFSMNIDTEPDDENAIIYQSYKYLAKQHTVVVHGDINAFGDKKNAYAQLSESARSYMDNSLVAASTFTPTLRSVLSQTLCLQESRRGDIKTIISTWASQC